MKFCSKCGKELFDEAVICTACGCATEKTFDSKAENSPTNDIVKIREFSEKAQMLRNFGIVAAVLMFGIGIIFSIIIWIKLPKVENYPKLTTTNPIELAEFETAKRKMSLAGILSMMPVLGIALSFFIGVMIGISGAF